MCRVIVPVVRKSALVEHPAAGMFALVDRVEDYPLFLPWCAGIEVIERRRDLTHATIHAHFSGVRVSFTTRNHKHSPEWMRMELSRGPFRSLSGYWRFTALAQCACKVEFGLEYEFASAVVDRLVGPAFNRIADTMVDAFLARAEQIAPSDR